MLHYWLEFEESMGKVWDKYLNKKVHKFDEDARVNFEDISTTLAIFHRLLGGEKAKELRITDKRTLEISRTLLEKLSFLGKEFFLTWQDDNSLYLPASLAYFPTKQENEMLYYWLVAMAIQCDTKDASILEQNKNATDFLVKKYSGFALFYENAITTLTQKYEELSYLKSLENCNEEDLIDAHPSPLWIYPSALTLKKAKNGESDEEEPTS